MPIIIKQNGGRYSCATKPPDISFISEYAKSHNNIFDVSIWGLESGFAQLTITFNNFAQFTDLFEDKKAAILWAKEGLADFNKFSIWVNGIPIEKYEGGKYAL